MFALFCIGWISKAVLYPLLKACFSGHLRENEIKLLLTSISFKSLVNEITLLLLMLGSVCITACANIASS